MILQIKHVVFFDVYSYIYDILLFCVRWNIVSCLINIISYLLFNGMIKWWLNNEITGKFYPFSTFRRNTIHVQWMHGILDGIFVHYIQTRSQSESCSVECVNFMVQSINFLLLTLNDGLNNNYRIVIWFYCCIKIIIICVSHSL